MRRFTAASGLLLLAGGLLVAPPAGAQFGGGGMQQRYKKSSQTSSVDEAIRKLTGDDADARLEGARLLGASRDPKGIPYLIQAVGDGDVRVQVKAIEMLGMLRATEATPVLVQQLFLRTTEPQMKQRLLAALGAIGDPRGAKPILEFLHRDLDVATRGTAVFALGDIGSGEALETLEKISTTDQDPTVRRIAFDAAHKVRHYQSVRQKDAQRPTDTFLPKAPREDAEQP